jgi:hypothetical protein
MTDNQLSSVLDKLGAVKDTMTVSRVFGESYQVDGTTIVPVATTNISRVQRPLSAGTMRAHRFGELAYLQAPGNCPRLQVEFGRRHVSESFRTSAPQAACRGAA